MSDPKPPAEPSMEAILATVRRIIAEDEFGMAKPSAGAQIVSSDVLELTEALDADGSVRQIPPSLALRGPGQPRGEPRLPPLPDGRIEPAPPRPGIAEPAGRAEAQGSRGAASGDLGRSEPVVSRARETATVSPISTGR